MSLLPPYLISIHDYTLKNKKMHIYTKYTRSQAIYKVHRVKNIMVLWNSQSVAITGYEMAQRCIRMALADLPPGIGKGQIQSCDRNWTQITDGRSASNSQMRPKSLLY